MKNEQGRARISLARALSKLGYTSRSQARPLITSGRVTVNGNVVSDPEQRIDIERDDVAVDGAPVTAASYVYVVLNKPRGYVTTRSDERGRPTVFDLFSGANLPFLMPVGRLDLDSSGLLLFTNDTRWADAITAPEKHVDKVYQVTIDRVADMHLIDAMLRGVKDKGEVLRAKSASIVEVTDQSSQLEIMLDEGKNRHIRRMLSALGANVTDLMRIAIGPLQMGKLKPGEYRMLTVAEVEALTK